MKSLWLTRKEVVRKIAKALESASMGEVEQIANQIVDDWGGCVAFDSDSFDVIQYEEGDEY